MTINVNRFGDNPFSPGMVADTYVPDQLIAGSAQITTQEIIVVGGPYVRGTVLGAFSGQPVESQAGQNTGTGSISNISASAATLFGAYVIIAKAANDFSVVDPEGNALPDAVPGTAYSQEGLNFLITAGSTAFVAGDSFTLTVIQGAVGQYRLSVATATDGSQVPACILVDTMPVAGPEPAGAYFSGEFNVRALTYDPSWTPATLRAAIRPTIFIKSSVSAADPT